MPEHRGGRCTVLVCKTCGQEIPTPHKETISNALKRIGMYPERSKDGKKRKV